MGCPFAGLTGRGFFFTNFFFKRKNQKTFKHSPLSNLVSTVAQQNLSQNTDSMLENSYEKALAQRQLRKAYSEERFSYKTSKQKTASYLNMDSSEEAYMEYRDYYRKQTERTFQDEESKKVFMISY